MKKAVYNIEQYITEVGGESTWIEGGEADISNYISTMWGIYQSV